MYDIIIIGAGPAGMTAALYGRRANKSVLVLEAKNYGGQIVNASSIENYPGIEKISGYDYATTLFNQITNLGVEIKYETVIKINSNKEVTTTKNTYQAKSIIIANGAQNRHLNLPLETDFIGKGVSYCATCDGAFYKDKDVAVLGGGNTALEDAIYLSNLANKVYLIHRRDTFRGEEKYLKELETKENVEIILNSTITKLNGHEKLESITIKNKEKREKEINISGLFIAIGQVPNNTIFKDIVDINDKGYIVSEDGVHTKTEGIYVAGDTRVKDLRQLTTAVSDGSIAAMTAIKEMKN